MCIPRNRQRILEIFLNLVGPLPESRDREMNAWSEKRIAHLLTVMQQMLYFYDDDAPAHASMLHFACLVIQLRCFGYKGGPLGLEYMRRCILI